MTVLSRYVLRSFAVPLSLSLAAFIFVFIVVDLVDRLSTFIDRDIPIEKIIAYYLWYTPTVGMLVLPMAMLLACLFCVGGLGRFGELTAMKAAGLNLIRILAPILVLATVISAGAYVFVDHVVPAANQRRSEIDNPGYANERLPNVRGIRSRVVMIGEAGSVVSIGEYHPRDRTGRRVMVDTRADGARIVEKITAERMVWEGKQWVFLDGEVRRFQEEAREVVATFQRMAMPNLGVLPEDLARKEEDTEQMTNAALSRFIRRKQRFGSSVTREEVERHLRTSFPVANLVIVAFGLPLSTRIRRTGRPLQVGICLLASFVFYGCLQAGRAMGWNGLMPPFWGAWAANIIFGVVGGFLLARSHT